MKRRGLRGIIGSHSRFTAPCTWQRKPSSAYWSARTMPDFASRSEASTSWVLFPIEDTTPMPVTTTRLIREPLLAIVVAPAALQPRAAPACYAIAPTTLSAGHQLLAHLVDPDPQTRGL